MSPDDKKIELERERLSQEKELKVLELEHAEKLKELELAHEKDLKIKELENQNVQLLKGQWTGPVFAAVLAGVIGIGSTFLSGYQTREIERQKQEGTILLEAIKTTDTGTNKEQQTAANLVFFADAGLVNIPKEKLETLRTKADGALPSLSAGNSVNQPKENSKAYRKIAQDLTYAVKYLNLLFEMRLDVPNILSPDITDTRNAYTDSQNQYIAPADVQYLPDLTYFNAVHRYIRKTANLRYYGQQGALHQSYTYVFASLIKQKRLNQTALTADWTIGPKGIAWVRGEDISTTKRNEPILSLKSPGTAYDDPVVGKDPQPAHMKDYFNDPLDGGGVHINCGIPNKAFYETAMVIGSEKAGKICYKGLLKLHQDSDFNAAAVSTIEASGELHGVKSVEQNAVINAWTSVGVSTVAKAKPK